MTPFYDLALRLFTRTQRNQIQKGIEKYPNTFNPREWSPQELLNHALEETVDLTHYLVGLKVLLDDRDEEISRLKHQLALAQGELSQKKPSYMDLDDE